jgi:hypothetical protein
VTQQPTDIINDTQLVDNTKQKHFGRFLAILIRTKQQQAFSGFHPISSTELSTGFVDNGHTLVRMRTGVD